METGALPNIIFIHVLALSVQILDIVMSAEVKSLLCPNELTRKQSTDYVAQQMFSAVSDLPWEGVEEKDFFYKSIFCG